MNSEDREDGQPPAGSGQAPAGSGRLQQPPARVKQAPARAGEAKNPRKSRKIPEPESNFSRNGPATFFPDPGNIFPGFLGALGSPGPGGRRQAADLWDPGPRALGPRAHVPLRDARCGAARSELFSPWFGLVRIAEKHPARRPGAGAIGAPYCGPAKGQ